MSRRSESFDKYIAQEMQDLDFAKETLIMSMTEFNESVEDALKFTIQKMGLKEFSALSNIPIQNISQFIKGKRKLKIETLDKYLAVFKLKSQIIVKAA